LAALLTGKSLTIRVETNRVNSSYCDLAQIAINNQENLESISKKAYES